MRGSEVKAKAMAHAQIVHADILKTMSSPAQMAATDSIRAFAFVSTSRLSASGTLGGAGFFGA